MEEDIPSVPPGFSPILSVTPDPQEFIKKWARYSRGAGSEPEYVKDNSFIRHLVDVSYYHEDPNLRGELRSDVVEDHFFGLPHDTRRLIPGYIQAGDRVFVWGHPWLHPIYNLRWVLSIESPWEWLRGRLGRDRYFWSGAMELRVGRYLEVLHSSPIERYVHLKGDEHCLYRYSKANLALYLEDHFNRLSSDEYVCELWECRTRELDLDRKFDLNSVSGYGHPPRGETVYRTQMS